ncbi:MAG: sigma factor, partial [Bacillota bacterium]
MLSLDNPFHPFLCCTHSYLNALIAQHLLPAKFSFAWFVLVWMEFLCDRQEKNIIWSNFPVVGKMRPLDSIELKFFFELFAQRVFQAAYFILRDRVLAEDVMQETFLVAVEKLGDLRDPAKIEIWLTRIAVNKALNERRKRTTRVLFKNIPT